MSTVHDTTNLKPYKLLSIPTMEDSMMPFVIRELQSISASLNATIVALKAIEARIVVGGL